MSKYPFEKRVSRFTMTNARRQHDLWENIAVVEPLDGDYVETGVYRGGSSMIMALTLLRMGKAHNTLWLYDTFQGMPRPNARETKIRTREKCSDIYEKKDRRWCYSTLDEVKKNMARTGYDPANIRYVKGKVENTLRRAENLPDKIKLLRLDTDFYESTKAALKYLYPLLVEGGYIIIDDYNAFSGCKEAVHEYFGKELPHLEYSDKSAIGFFKREGS